MSLFSFFSLLTALPLDKIPGWISFGSSAVAVLAVLIVVHEFGHFITARMVGVRVQKFSIGFGKKLFGRTYGDTEYMLCLIPLGGYVKFYGDDPDEPIENEQDSFLNQDVWKRLAIVVAGPLFNLLLTVFIIMSAAIVGMPVLKTDTGGEKPVFIVAALNTLNQTDAPPIISHVKEGSPADVAGMEPKDKILTIDGAKIVTWADMVQIVKKAPGKELEVIVERAGGATTTLLITPEAIEKETPDGKKISIGRLGVSHQSVSGEPVLESYSIPTAFFKGLEWTWDLTYLTVLSLKKLVSSEIPAKEIAGPVGIMQMAGHAADAGLVNLLMFIGIISVNLGILNLLPIPVLDGGHIVFFTLEALLGRPVTLKTQEVAQQVGIALLMTLMAFAFYNDIMRLVSG